LAADTIALVEISALSTPAALVDVERVERNCARMSEKVARLGARLRPHVKTHKCAEIARLSVRGHFGGLTVSTLAEAHFFAAQGFRDLTWAVPVAPQRLGEVAELTRTVERLNLLLDHPATLTAVESFAAAQRVRFSVFLKVDCGYHRAGVDPRDPESIALALRLARSPHIDFRGVLTHAGHSYHCRDAHEIRAVARDERDVTVRFAETLRAAGARVEEVSIGSTPTINACDGLTGVTEVRPGNYVFYDAFQTAIGSCAPSDAAFSVLATVIGQYPARNQILVDAGALALSKDAGPDHVDPQCGFGLVCTASGEALPHLRVANLSQEHGLLSSRAAIDFARFPIGSRLRIVANHSCLAAALFDRYFAVKSGEVVAQWRPARGW
jgi:D-serine deaminase-like pyridoxal phosphate-dependent protein